MSTQIDGKNSVPYQKDQSNQRYGRISASGCGGAHHHAGQCAHSAFPVRARASRLPASVWAWSNRAKTLQTSTMPSTPCALGLAYLYTNTSGDRYWFTCPTLRKTARTVQIQVAEADVEEEIETRLKAAQGRAVTGIARLPGFLLMCRTIRRCGSWSFSARMRPTVPMRPVPWSLRQKIS